MDKDIYISSSELRGGNMFYDGISKLFIQMDTARLRLPEIKDVIFNNPATIVKWADGTKTVVKCNPKYSDDFDYETGLAMAICKKALGNKGNFNDVFRKWVYENPRLNIDGEKE